MKIVMVEWEDAGLEHNQMALEQAVNLQAMPRQNVGFLLHESRDKIILAFGNIQDMNCGTKVWDCCLIVPRSMIKNIQDLHLAGEQS